MPVVSVIVPTYNGEKYLALTLESIRDQTYADWECIIVDDGSSDKSREIARQFAARDGRFVCLHQANAGVAGARNTGIAAARGGLIAFLDQDDVWSSRKLEISVGELQESGADLIFTQSYIFKGDNLPGDISGLTISGEPAFYQGPRAVEDFLDYNRVPVLTVLARKEALEATGGFRNAGGTDDYRMWLEMLMQGRTILGIGEPLAFYRVHEKATSAADISMSRSVVTMLWQLRGDYPDYPVAFRPYVRKWIRYILKWVYKPDDREFITEQLRLWKIHSPGIDACLAMRKIIPSNWFRQSIRFALKNWRPKKDEQW